ncbi:MAG: Nif3-like dinuclear metal center hexameric protein [Deltaproteobacteria bacterium]|nr:Nif3-like dinuclear metal center hexameric protein [Deltaproteobacteria bacterium]
MLATIGDIIQAMETLAPSDLAEPWDNVGLQVGKRDWPVRTVWVALDPSFDVVTGAWGLSF